MPEERETIKIQEVVNSNMLTVNALLELLADRGVLAMKEAMERIGKLQAESRIKLET